MSYEVRIGLLAAIIIAITVWGYQFMKGKNLLSAANTYYVEYANINELTATSPVLIRGLRVGTVTEISLSDDLQTITATLDIQRGIRLAKGTEALVVSTSIMGGKAVVLATPGPCEGDQCHKPGDYLIGRVQGMFESMLGDSDIDEFVDKAKEGIGEVFSTLSDSLSSPEAQSDLAKSFQDIQQILHNIEGITTQLNGSMATYDRSIRRTLSNVEEVTGVLADNNTDIATSLQNLSQLTEDLKNADLGGKTASIASTAEEAVVSMRSTLENADAAIAELNTLLSGINNGEGTLGKLAANEELYDNLNRTSQNLDLLLQDFRLNPKRYVNVSVFGKKQKDYAVPEEDPAFEENGEGGQEDNDD